jgi:hypothetical protein
LAKTFFAELLLAAAAEISFLPVAQSRTAMRAS